MNEPLEPRAERCPEPECTDDSICWRCQYEESQHKTVNQTVWEMPQDVYDTLMSLPPGTDVTDLFDMPEGWNLTVRTGNEDQW